MAVAARPVRESMNDRNRPQAVGGRGQLSGQPFRGRPQPRYQRHQPLHELQRAHDHVQGSARHDVLSLSATCPAASDCAGGVMWRHSCSSRLRSFASTRIAACWRKLSMSAHRDRRDVASRGLASPRVSTCRPARGIGAQERSDRWQPQPAVLAACAPPHHRHPARPERSGPCPLLAPPAHEHLHQPGDDGL